MRAVPLLLLAVTVSTSAFAQTSVSAPAPIDVVKLEQNLWTTMAEDGFGAVRVLLTPDFLEVDNHIQAADALLIHLKHCKLTSYELRDLQVRVLTPDSVMTAYNVVSSFACEMNEKTETKNYDDNSTTIWVRRPGASKWLVQAHTETPTRR
ncbi:MAG: nuclear transport factor 2 family protein [Acidobacteriota bacterium]|nr:nuclear transport factor 2 family protein [Acidobacteriota bacterium]